MRCLGSEHPNAGPNINHDFWLRRVGFLPKIQHQLDLGGRREKGAELAAVLPGYDR